MEIPCLPCHIGSPRTLFNNKLSSLNKETSEKSRKNLLAVAYILLAAVLLLKFLKTCLVGLLCLLL
jgi:hypothetical protein